MTKFLILMFCFLGLAHAQQKADYDILGGKLHKGGSASLEVLPETDKFVVFMKYQLKKKALVPVPSDALDGDYTLELPQSFRDERGYAELEVKGKLDLEKAELIFVDRTNYGEYQNAYRIQILPKNGKSRIEFIYHPTAPGIGWANFKITIISKIPLFNGYRAEAVVRK